MLPTLHLRAEDPTDIERAAEILRRGGVVAFPTETVYGLGANALWPEAVGKIFQAKQRPSWDPLIVHLENLQALSSVASVEVALRNRVDRLAQAFWPGPLTMLFSRTSAVPDAVTAARSLVGVRLPSHPVAQALLRTTGLPLAAPSANRFGHTSPTTAQHVLNDLGGRIDAVLDGGPCSVGVESTVLDPQPTPMVVYRAGAVTLDALQQATDVQARLYEPAASTTAAHGPEALPSPGVGLRHYAPETTVLLTEGRPDALWAEVKLLESKGERVGVLLPADWGLPTDQQSAVVRAWGRWEAPESLARDLFAALRDLEQSDCTVLVCPLPEPGGMRDALRDRLLKAAKSR